jgi:hypothetical protein
MCQEGKANTCGNRDAIHDYYTRKLSRCRLNSVSVFCTRKYRVVKITRSSSEILPRTILV